MAQAPSDLQKNYSASGVFEYEPIPISIPADNTEQQLLDSIYQVQQDAIWQEWYDANKDQFTTSQENFTNTCVSDSLALIALYTATDGSNWRNQWDLMQPMSTWHGVELDDAGCVMLLNLNNNNLVGTLPVELGNLNNLISLSLSYNNNLTGTIPNSLANLSNLQVLRLESNDLSGTIPTWLGNLQDLYLLQLGFNELTGIIPDELSTLTNLHILSIKHNELTGSIPTWLGDLTTLEVLEIGGNMLTEGLPTELSNLTNLNSLNISNCETGTLPDWLGNMTDLSTLDIGDCELSTLPDWLGRMENLRYLYINDNKLTGVIPTNLSNLINLRSLYLYNNELTGEVPNWLNNLSALHTLNLGNNQLTGFYSTIPITLPNLRTLSLFSNKLDSLQNIVDNFPNLTNFFLSSNVLTFEDLLPNKDLFSSSFRYSPQNKFGTSTSVTLNEGDNYTLSFLIDPNTSNSTYRWYRNNTLVSTTTTPTLTLNAVTLNNAGLYRCEVTNPNLPDLTLESEEITINLNLPAIPPNDQCANAIPLTLGNFSCSTPTTGFTAGATNSNNDSPPAPQENVSKGEDVWYQFIVPSSGIFGLDIKKEVAGTHSATFILYTGTCGALSEQVGSGNFNGWSGNYSNIYNNIAPPGTTIYLRLWYQSTNEELGIFELCLYERPCQEPSIGWTEVLACEETAAYYAKFHLYDLGDATSITIFNDGGLPSTNNITATGTFPIGPLPLEVQTNFTIQHNQNSICNVTITLDGPYLNGTLASNDEPCTAIDLSNSYGAVYNYTETNTITTARICEPSVPISGGCRQSNSWNSERYRQSIWFTITAPPSGSFTLDLSTTARIALWSAPDCTTLLEGTPTLEYAFAACYGNSYEHVLTCLNPGETYYLQIVDAYNDFDISLEELVVPCGALPNDMCTNAIPITVGDELCSNATIYTNIGGTDSRNDPIPSPSYSTYGTDVWFSAVVPASGQLAMVFEIADNCFCRGRISLFRGTCNSLSYMQSDEFYHGNNTEKLFYNDLTPGETVYYTVDFRNTEDQPGYFKMCVLDPPCTPIAWDYNNYLTCEDSEQIIADLVIHNLNTTTQFDIINFNNNTSYYTDLTSTGTYRLGPFNRNEGIPFQIIQDTEFCNSEEFTYGVPSSANTKANDNMCDATNINTSIDNGLTSFTGNNSTLEICEPSVPVVGCNASNGWNNSNSYRSTWAYFDAISNNMSFTVNSTTGHWVKTAVWEAASCMDLKEGTPVFVKAIEPCNNRTVAQLDFTTLEIGKRYYILIEAYGEYDITLTSSAPSCYAPSALSTTAITPFSAMLNWNIAAVATDHKILYRIHQTNDAWTVVTNASTPLMISDLAANTTYEWSVQSLCENTSTSSSPYPDVQTFTTIEEICDTPSNLAANSQTPTSVDLSWDRVDNAVDYTVHFREVGDTDWLIAENVTPPYTVSRLAEGATYEWRVIAMCHSTESPASLIQTITFAGCIEDMVMNDAPIPSNNYQVAQTITSKGTVNAGTSVGFQAGESITLEPGFHAVEGSDFIAKIGTCYLSIIRKERVAITEGSTNNIDLASNLPLADVQLQVLPNPLQTEAIIQFYLPTSSTATIRVANLTGQLLSQQTIKTTKDWNQTTLDASELSEGLYYIILQTNDGIWTEKIMVSK